MWLQTIYHREDNWKSSVLFLLCIYRESVFTSYVRTSNSTLILAPYSGRIKQRHSLLAILGTAFTPRLSLEGRPSLGLHRTFMMSSVPALIVLAIITSVSSSAISRGRQGARVC
ncbi:hypothetical protein VTO42DRAFT_155 [Malbranchea cinnamomea]